MSRGPFGRSLAGERCRPGQGMTANLNPPAPAIYEKPGPALGTPQHPYFQAGDRIPDPYRYHNCKEDWGRAAGRTPAGLQPDAGKSQRTGTQPWTGPCLFSTRAPLGDGPGAS